MAANLENAEHFLFLHEKNQSENVLNIYSFHLHVLWFYYSWKLFPASHCCNILMLRRACWHAFPALKSFMCVSVFWKNVDHSPSLDFLSALTTLSHSLSSNASQRHHFPLVLDSVIHLDAVLYVQLHAVFSFQTPPLNTTYPLTMSHQAPCEECTAPFNFGGIHSALTKALVFYDFPRNPHVSLNIFFFLCPLRQV